MLEVLIGVGTFSSTSSFNTQCLLLVTMNELKKVFARRFAIFSFSLGSFVLMNNTSPDSFSVDFIYCKYHFSSAFKHRTD